MQHLLAAFAAPAAAPGPDCGAVPAGTSKTFSQLANTRRAQRFRVPDGVTSVRVVTPGQGSALVELVHPKLGRVASATVTPDPERHQRLTLTLAGPMRTAMRGRRLVHLTLRVTHAGQTTQQTLRFS